MEYENYQNPPEFSSKEVDKLRELLANARLSKYFTPLMKNGVTRVKDCQDYVREDFLIHELHMSQPERERFWKYVSKSRRFQFRSLFRKVNKPGERLYEETPAGSGGAKLINHQEISELGIIGKGAFGEVSKGMWHFQQNRPPRPVAVKVVRGYTEGDREQIMREAEVWNNLTHENIISLYGVTLTEPFKMIMELAPKGSLDKYLRTKMNQLSIERMWQYSSHISCGMEYLHSKRIIHRDLACRNVLLITEFQVKISDFGMTRFLPVEKDLMETFTPQKVPFAWTSLEVLESHRYTKANDVWSFAVTMWEIFSYGARPWEGLNMQHVKFQLQTDRRLEQPNLCSDEIFGLMTSCWGKSPEDRPSFSDIQVQLTKVKPKHAIAKMDSPNNLDEDQCVPYRKEDMICIIEKKLGEYWVGQSQMNLKVGYVFASDMDTDPKKIQAYQKNKAKQKQRIVDPADKPPEYLSIDQFAYLRNQELGPEENYEAPLEEDPNKVDVSYEEFVPYEELTTPDEKDTEYMSVRLANRIKLTDSYIYTTMVPREPTRSVGDTNGREDQGICGGLKLENRNDPSDGEDESIVDPYAKSLEQKLKDSYGYDQPNEPVTLRKIDSSSNTNSYYDDTIDSDTALTPQQLGNRKRASIKIQQTQEPNYESCVSDPSLKPLPLPKQNLAQHFPLKPIPPPKPHNLNRRESAHGNRNLVPATKPLNESILAQEFPQMPEDEISVILSISEGNLKEARKDVKFKLFRETMQEENPMLQSVFCYDVLKRAGYDIETARREILTKYPKRNADDNYETLS